MKKETILKKAISQAVKNGYNPNVPALNMWIMDGEIDFEMIFQDNCNEFYAIIFSHDFAKAFWGEEETIDDRDSEYMCYLPAWQIHLSKMVLEEDPIKYLEQFI